MWVCVCLRVYFEWTHNDLARWASNTSRDFEGGTIRLFGMRRYVPEVPRFCRMRVLRGKLTWHLPGQSSVVGPLLSSLTHFVTLLSCPCLSSTQQQIVSCPAMRTMGAVSCGSLRLRATSPAFHPRRRHGCT